MKKATTKTMIVLFLLIFTVTVSFTLTPAFVDAATIKAPSKVKGFKSTYQGTTSVKLKWKKVEKSQKCQWIQDLQKSSKFEKVEENRHCKRQ